MRDGKVLIAGGGIGGLAAAIALRRAGIRAEVYERVSELREIGAGLMISSNGVIALRHLDLAGRVEEEGGAARRGYFRWWKGRILFQYPVKRLEEEMGAPVLAIHRGRMLQILKETFGDAQIHTDSEAVGHEQTDDGVVLHLADGRTVEGSVLIAADGLNSCLRAGIAGDGPPRYAGYTSWRGVTSEGSLVEPGLGSETWGPGRRFGLMHVGKKEVCWFGMWTTAEVGGADEPGQLHRKLGEIFAGWPSPIPELIRATPEDQIVRTDIMDRAPLDRWGRGRVTLLGDAAHPMTPNMGQGASQAIEDAVVLARCLERADDWSEGLRRYEERRIPRTRWFVESSRSFGNFAQVRNPLLCMARNLMMRITPESRFVSQLRSSLEFELEA